ncbi:MAG: cupredoxin domain-containing protein [Acidimicrobiales bacterium]|nr:cupredoxin domain-containing protein [Acidimicrobiales bacterium]
MTRRPVSIVEASIRSRDSSGARVRNSYAGAALLVTWLWLSGLGLAACGGDAAIHQSSSVTAGGDDVATTLPGEPVDMRGQKEVTIEVTDNVFTPNTVTVDVGTTLVFVNKGRNSHNVIPSVKGTFAEVPTGKLDPGMQARITFENPGTFGFYCSLHGTPTRGQRGAVIVTA